MTGVLPFTCLCCSFLFSYSWWSECHSLLLVSTNYYNHTKLNIYCMPFQQQQLLEFNIQHCSISTQMYISCPNHPKGCHDFRQSRSLPLFRRRSALDITGLLATADPLFIFHSFCLSLTHLVSLTQLPVYYLILCSPCSFVSDCFL
jgi:hypothetical protein